MISDPANGQWPLVTLFGGSGFVGRHLVRLLAKDEVRIRVACRRPELAGHLQPLGRVGQIQVVQANLRFPESVVAAVRGADAVVNLVGVLRISGRQTFEAVHVEGAGVVAGAARDAGVRTLVHMSALGADSASPSAYARTKAEGEAAVFEAAPDAIVMRPSVVFGQEDNFLNRFAALARMSPVLPLIGDGATRFQPVFVGDVASAFHVALDGRARSGAVYELGGQRVMTYKEIVEFVCRATHRSRVLARLPWPAADGVAFVNQFVAGFGLLPEWAVLTRDQVELLRADNVVSAAATADGRTLQGLGVTPDSIESIAATYLWRFRKTGQYDHAA